MNGLFNGNSSFCDCLPWLLILFCCGGGCNNGCGNNSCFCDCLPWLLILSCCGCGCGCANG